MSSQTFQAMHFKDRISYNYEIIPRYKAFANLRRWNYRGRFTALVCQWLFIYSSYFRRASLVQLSFFRPPPPYSSSSLCGFTSVSVCYTLPCPLLCQLSSPPHLSFPCFRQAAAPPLRCTSPHAQLQQESTLIRTVCAHLVRANKRLFLNLLVPPLSLPRYIAHRIKSFRTFSSLKTSSNTSCSFNNIGTLVALSIYSTPQIVLTVQ